MSTSDLSWVLEWWFLFFTIGLAFFPFSSLLFTRLLDKGYIFSKIIGTLLITYSIFALCTLHIFSFTFTSTLITAMVLFLVSLSIFILFTKKPFAILFNNWQQYVFEEFLFFTGLYFWSFIKAYQPDIHGLEKYMDYGFINSILRSSYFPPKDMWFTPLSINYYYFGHLYTAVLTRLSGINSSVTFNLMIATILGLSFSMSYSIATSLLSIYVKSVNSALRSKTIVIAGIISASLVTFSGNLHTIYTFFQAYPNENPVPFWTLPFLPSSFPNSYWYPNATRFIMNTIHEFPMYSFVVSDLHGHVLSIPIVLTMLALLFCILSSHKKLLHMICMGFLIAISYMTNAWDGIIYFILTALILLFSHIIDNPLKGRSYIQYAKNISFPIAISTAVLITSVILFLLPFSLFFKPFVSGVGVLCAPQFLTNIERIGPFLFEVNHCQKSPLWQLFILYGYFYFWVILFFFQFKKEKKNLSNFFVLALILVSTFLIIFPEFFYMKDIYPAHYRANTMFKLGYQAFIMLSLTSGYVAIKTIITAKNNFPRLLFQFNILKIGQYLVVGIFALTGSFLVLIYPYFSTVSYFDGLKNYSGLDGTSYLEKLYPSDYKAISWINTHITNQPVLVEAQGDSYTDFGRVSTNTGLPTILGWTVHEWLWRGTYDIPAPRIPDVQTLYEIKDVQTAKNILKKYNVSYIFVGQLERQKYHLQEDKFLSLGTLVYQQNETSIYKMFIY